MYPSFLAVGRPQRALGPIHRPSGVPESKIALKPNVMAQPVVTVLEELSRKITLIRRPRTGHTVPGEGLHQCLEWLLSKAAAEEDPVR